jgi:hypothetical protein
VTEAQELREAARLMRERANAATPGPWQHECLGSDFCMVFAGEWMRDHHNAEHVAGWSPELAVVIADILDDAAHQLELSAGRHGSTDDPAAIEATLRIARTYMRSGS